MEVSVFAPTAVESRAMEGTGDGAATAITAVKDCAFGGPASIIDAVHLKNRLREIEANGDDAGHGSSLRLVERLHPTPRSRRGWSMPSSGSCSTATCRSRRWQNSSHR